MLGSQGVSASFPLKEQFVHVCECEFEFKPIEYYEFSQILLLGQESLCLVRAEFC